MQNFSMSHIREKERATKLFILSFTQDLLTYEKRAVSTLCELERTSINLLNHLMYKVCYGMIFHII